MKIWLGADHRGQHLQEKLYNYLKEKGMEAEISSIATSSDDDYTDFALDVCKHVKENPNDMGILICGNGIGMSIAANKVKDIRCARVNNEEEAKDAREHNSANVIALGSDLITEEEAFQIIETFRTTPLATEERHVRRVNKLIEYENRAYNEL